MLDDFENCRRTCKDLIIENGERVIGIFLSCLQQKQTRMSILNSKKKKKKKKKNKKKKKKQKNNPEQKKKKKKKKKNQTNKKKVVERNDWTTKRKKNGKKLERGINIFEKKFFFSFRKKEKRFPFLLFVKHTNNL